MPSIDLTPYYQPQGSTSDGNKYDNGLALIQSTLNAVDNNNIAANAAIVASKLNGLATVLGAQNVGSANTDLQGPGASRSDLYVVTTGTGTLRSIAAPTENGSRVVIRNGSGSSITLKHQLAGGTGAQLYLRTVADVTLLDKELVEFVYDGTNWVEIGRDQASAAAGATTYRKATAKAVNTTIAATDLLNGEITVGAGVLGATGKARLTANGDWLQNAAAGVVLPRFQLVLGGTTLIDTGANTRAAGQSATRTMWRVIAEITNTATNAQNVVFLLEIAAILGGTAAFTTFTTGTGIYDTGSTTSGTDMRNYAKGYNTAAVDTTASKTLVLNVINGSNSASYETKLFDALVEII